MTIIFGLALQLFDKAAETFSFDKNSSRNKARGYRNGINAVNVV
jgi:hypothetical protein